MKIGAEITLHKLIEAGVKFIFEKTTKTKTKNNTVGKKQCSNDENSGAASNSGENGAASNSGENGAAFTIGSYSESETNANESVAIAIGYDNKAKGNLGSWIVLAERKNTGEILDIQSVKVDGTAILADTFYSLKKGNLIKED